MNVPRYDDSGFALLDYHLGGIHDNGDVTVRLQCMRVYIRRYDAENNGL